ncbi:hypothetical protein SAMN05428944_2183 [Streptomyces sp. 1222.5]|uniref:hypothetical protein n=1 Tax=unclassified Streptomyces TaxID=2593676 RepID=UPI000897AFC2|nr:MULTISPECIES: hypothetical protein [unclassified Streptomyces]PKW10619.1 hypothetical protein BX260_5911 [Streptomyces sp. 5112.2]SEC01231.1 hypothetical protein SAMN05428944_2183 [Streptomyces sp. 1222.5]
MAHRKPRSVYPFPHVAQHTDAGYTPVLSRAECTLTLNWLGSFRSGYETAGDRVHGK